MNSGLVAVICAVVGVVPLAVGTEYIMAAIFAVIYFFVGWLFIYWGAPSTVYPLLGGPGFLAWIWLAISSAVDLAIRIKRKDDRDDRRMPSLGWILPVIGLVIYIVTAVGYSAMFNASGYAAMIGQPEERVWTQDVQPKDPKHMLMGSEENALYQADKAIAQAGAIGSQFQVDKSHVTLQKINDKWYYIVPLEYRSFSVYYFGADGIPAYIKVSAEDPNRQAQLVELKDKMKFAPSAYFGNYLKRHLRYNGFLNSDIYEYLLEVDEDGNAWWVVPIYKPKLGWWGEQITEVAQINPANGEIKRVQLDAIPAWMDRVFPGDLAKDYLTWKGTYHAGWVNSVMGKTNVTVAKSAILIYGADSEPYWVIGITSDNPSDKSLVDLAYTDARTGKTVLYKMSGGTTEEAIVEAIDNNDGIKFRHLHGVNPQVYNCYGTMASVVPLMNDSCIFSGVAIVDIMNTQRLAVGKNQEQALRQFQRLLEQNGQQIAIDKSRILESVDDTVARIGFDHGSNVYYLLLTQKPGHLFTMDATEHPELPVTQPGDRVRLKFENSGERVMPVVEFQNLAVPLEGTAAESAVKQQADEARDKEQVRNAGPTVKEDVKKQLEHMTPEQLEELQKSLQK